MLGSDAYALQHPHPLGLAVLHRIHQPSEVVRLLGDRVLRDRKEPHLTFWSTLFEAAGEAAALLGAKARHRSTGGAKGLASCTTHSGASSVPLPSEHCALSSQ